jgi:hypothetical protein
MAALLELLLITPSRLAAARRSDGREPLQPPRIAAAKPAAPRARPASGGGISGIVVALKPRKRS